MPTGGSKRIGIGIAACAAVIAGVLAMPSIFVRADEVREAVRTEIRAATGFDPVLSGGVSVSAFPNSSATFLAVSLGDGDGPTPLKAERMIVQLRWLPLLLGRIEVAQLTLVEPQIVIEFDAQGGSNWSGLLTALLTTLKPNVQAPSSVSFSEIRLVDGSVLIRHGERGAGEALSSVDISLAWPSIATSFGATGQFVWRGEKVEASVSLTDFVAALAGDRSGLKLRMTSAPLKVGFDGHMGHRPTLKVEGALAVDSASLRDALLWMNRKPFLGGGLGRFALKAQTSVVGNIVSLTGLNVEVDGNSAEGVMTLAMGSRPLLQGTMAAEEIDITPYLSGVRLLGGHDRHWSRTPIALEGFSSLDFDLRLSASRVALGDSRAGRTAIGASLRNGRLGITIGESQAFGGVVRGSIALGKVATGAAIKADLNFADVDMDACLRALLGIRRLEGRGSLALSLESEGRDIEDLTRKLKGAGQLTAHKGALTGLNVEQLLRRLERRPLSGPGSFRSGRTPFDRLTVGMTIADGRATVDHVEMEAGQVRLALDGSALIPTRQLDLKGIASLSAAVTKDTQAFELPFVVRGNWDDPIMLPDVPSLIQRSGAAAPLLDAVRRRDTRDAVRSVIEKLTASDPGRPEGEPPGGPAFAPQQ